MIRENWGGESDNDYIKLPIEIKLSSDDIIITPGNMKPFVRTMCLLMSKGAPITCEKLIPTDFDDFKIIGELSAEESDRGKSITYRFEQPETAHPCE